MPQAELGRSRRRPHPRPPAQPVSASEPASAPDLQHGVVKWFNHSKGYGFIHCHDGSEVFVHESAVILGTSDLPLAKGREVEFELRQGARGSQAYSVVILGDSAPAEPEVEDANPSPPPQPGFDLSKRIPPSWQRKAGAFVYTYTIYPRRNS